MDQVWPVVAHPFTWGLALGLIIVAFVWKSAWTARGNFKREIKRLADEVAQLQQHLNTHLKITAAGSERLEKELAELKAQNENLRVNLASAQQKPGRAEARQLQAYEAAASRMREQAPGFAAAWEQALRQALAEQESAESGLTKFMRKVLPGSSAPVGGSEPVLPARDSQTSGQG